MTACDLQFTNVDSDLPAIANATALESPNDDLGPQPWHKFRRGDERYLCGKPRARQWLGLPSQGGGPGPRCPVCEVVYLNLLYGLSERVT